MQVKFSCIPNFKRKELISVKIGFVSTWGEVGAGYVTKNYVDLLKDNNEIFIYPRGLKKHYDKGSDWDLENVEKTPNFANTNLNWSHFNSWIKRNNLDIIFFNEQVNILPVLMIKKKHPEIKLGTYVDYYKNDTIKDFKLYDFIICNTKRHFSVFKELHEQVYYVKWGVNIDLFTQYKIEERKELVFFHSNGWSRNRKGTDMIIRNFIDRKFYNDSKLVIHTQVPLTLDFDPKAFNIEIINETISHPGLYHKGDVYLYPTILEGLGLTMYEALVSGLPIVVPDNGPMNELVNEINGRLLSIDRYYSRADGYYWPLCKSNENDLADAMQYYISLKDNIFNMKIKVRENAIKEFNWADRHSEIMKIFLDTKIINRSENELNNEIKRIRSKYYKTIGKSLLELTSNKVIHYFGKKGI